MSAKIERLSVPVLRTTIPRPLLDSELGTLVALADALCGPNDRVDPPSRQPDYPRWLEVAMVARNDSFDALVALAGAASTATDADAWLRTLHTEDAESFQVLSAVLGGAYLMVPAVRESIGYPGQRRDPAGLEEAVDELSDGILDPVLDRGFFFVPTPKAD